MPQPKVRLLLIILFAIAATNASATLIAYDSFDYPTGNIYNGVTPDGSGRTNTWSGGAATINPYGLTYPGLPTANLSMINLGANSFINHMASAPNSGSVWVSFLFVQASDAGGNRNGIILAVSMQLKVSFLIHCGGERRG
ncbi:MAG TPA: hypothetical protein VH595_01560 [Verrucomicrobiae bacterium]|jgi:hypothetical protein|nr:hypothetical protein [Verrucomicrobiae bacterium]